MKENVNKTYSSLSVTLLFTGASDVWDTFVPSKNFFSWKDTPSLYWTLWKSPADVQYREVLTAIFQLPNVWLEYASIVTINRILIFFEFLNNQIGRCYSFSYGLGSFSGARPHTSIRLSAPAVKDDSETVYIKYCYDEYHVDDWS